MAERIATCDTVAELIEMLKKFPPDKKVRTETFSHTFMVDVTEHERCIVVGA